MAKFQPSALSRSARHNRTRAAVSVRRARSNPRSSVTVSSEADGSSAYDRARQVAGIVSLVAVPVTWAVSYNRNHSVGWALLHGFISVPYLIYVGISGPRE